MIPVLFPIPEIPTPGLGLRTQPEPRHYIKFLYSAVYSE